MYTYNMLNFGKKYNHSRNGFTLVEAMVGIILFCLMFTYIFKAFAPTATDGHNLLRGTTIAMNACNWYINSLEQRIQYDGSLPEDELGVNDITNYFSSDDFSDIKMLRALKVISLIQFKNNLYTVKITFNWGNSESDKERKHHFEMSRLLVKPSI